LEEGRRLIEIAKALGVKPEALLKER
jgi:hypothetical protein